MIKWEILIATLCSRTESLARLLGVLMPQVDEVGRGDVHVTAYRNQGERPLADIRQALIDFSQAEYVSFIDDDDLPADDYVETILPLLDGVDTINWRMQVYIDGQAQKPTFHGLAFGGWYENVDGYYRDVSHLNPMRAELTRRCDFTKRLPPEDYGWVEQIRELVKTEHVIPYTKVMYHYYHSSTAGSMWVPGVAAKRYLGGILPACPKIDSPNFFVHPRSTC